MNRIYQGRVTGAFIQEKVKGKKERLLRPFPNWEEALWQHHVLFQDAVNYYLVALLAMATREDNPLWDIKQRLASEDPQDEHQVWRDFRRKGETRDGMMRSVAKYLTPGNDAPSPEECYETVLAGNEVRPEVLDLALRLLLAECAGDSAIQQKGNEYLPRLCWKEYNGKFSTDKARKDDALRRTALLVHSGEAKLDAIEAGLKMDTFANLAEGKPNRDLEASRQLLMDALDYTARFSNAVAGKREQLQDRIEGIAELSIPAYTGGSINKEALKRRFHAYLLFRYVEQSEATLSALKETLPIPKPSNGRGKKDNGKQTDFLAFGEDPVKLSRGRRGFAFPAFTALPAWSSEPSTLVWKDFDTAAFKEALKTLHQIDLKTHEREAEAAKKQERLDYIWGRQDTWDGGESDEEEPPVLAGDPRISRLVDLVERDLADAYDLTEGEETAYGLSARTVRGFKDLRQAWRKLAAKGKLDEAGLLKALREHQTANSNRMGSAMLFEALAKEENHLIWQEPDEETAAEWQLAGFADDPLDALVMHYSLQEEVRRLGEPVRLTPADPVHSVRQYDFNPTKAAGTHVKDALAISVPMAMADPETGLLGKGSDVRFVYGAPRLLRDGLRSAATHTYGDAAWLPPMLMALMPDLALRQPKMSKLAVMLMPRLSIKGERTFYLNLPVDIDTGNLAEKLPNRGLNLQTDFHAFGPRSGKTFKNLLWPGAKAETAWHTNDAPIQCLAADLGQRDAAAFALVEAAPAKSAPPHARKLGEVEGKTWYGTLKQMGMLRLPGEDATLYDPDTGKMVQERSGEKGRMPTKSEWQETRDLCGAMNQAHLLDGLDSDASFPQLNDKLLVALRRCQGRLAQLHRWAWILFNDDEQARSRRQKTLDSLASDEFVSPAWRDWAKKGHHVPLAQAVIKEARDLRKQLPQVLESVANRILPRRDAVWCWRKRGRAGFVLSLEKREERDGKVRIRGQRGLSLERLEQVEELRRRCQSLNRALMHTPGERPRMGRVTRGMELPDPCPDILDKMEALRTQRVSQTAHLIVAEALGVRLRPHQRDASERLAADIHGEYERIPGRWPVDMVALEDLSRYLTRQDRPRNENSRLMKWCHRQILAKVKELLEPFGIPVLEVMPAYSSRFSSRDGCAGFRAMDLTPAHAGRWPWKKDLADLQENKSMDSVRRKRCEATKKLFEQLERANRGRKKDKKPRTLLAPISGGPIFVPIEGPAMQADINAAVNLALRALAAPGAHDIHHRVRTERKGNALFTRLGNAREKACWGKKAELEPCDSETSDSRNPNYFFDAHGVADLDRAKIGDLELASGKGLWGAVKAKEWATVKRLNDDRLTKWGLNEEDIPF